MTIHQRVLPPRARETYAAAFLELMKLREQIENTLHGMVTILDAIDAETADDEDGGDAEPSLGWPNQSGPHAVKPFSPRSTVDLELDDSDDEPSLAAPELDITRVGNQTTWARGGYSDGEADDSDMEPSLASPEHIFPGDQTGWVRGNDRDLEDDDDREPDNDNEPSLGATEGLDQSQTWAAPGPLELDAERDDADDESNGDEFDGPDDNGIADRGGVQDQWGSRLLNEVDAE